MYDATGGVDAVKPKQRRDLCRLPRKDTKNNRLPRGAAAGGMEAGTAMQRAEYCVFEARVGSDTSKNAETQGRAGFRCVTAAWRTR